MSDFLTSKKKYKNYYDCLIITTWSEYQSLDKHQKIVAFTIEGIDDKDLLIEILKDQVKQAETGKPMHKDLKKKLKAYNEPVPFSSWLYRHNPDNSSSQLRAVCLCVD